MSPWSPGMSEVPEDCCICLDVLTRPAALPCGHAFCLACIGEYWRLSDGHWQCPLCKAHFPVRPDLRPPPPPQPPQHRPCPVPPTDGGATLALAAGEVPCDVCSAATATTSCLACLASYCPLHLEPHYRRPELWRHPLVAVGKNAEEGGAVCRLHGRPADRFCRSDRTCVCALCANGEHRGHRIVSISKEAARAKAKLKRRLLKLTQTIQEKVPLAESTTTTTTTRSATLRPAVRAGGGDDRGQAQGQVVKDLGREILDLQQRKAHLEELYQTTDPLGFLLTYSEPSEDNNITEIALDVSVCFGTFRSIVQNMLDDIHDKLERVTPIELQRILKFAVDVKLDPSTAHRRLIVSADGKEVHDGGICQEVPDGPQRYDLFASVLGQNPLTSGKAYWQVAVGDKVGWDLGVASVDSMCKGKLVFEPDTRYWVIVHYDQQEYAAMTAPPRHLTLKAKPRMVGVFLDYQEGLVSFYDLTSSSHIFSFTACVFSGELRPYFSPHTAEGGDNAEPLVISAV
ncbi:hypothetical protein NHX12_014182 [Muraenolepis orangiensis]|uniref:Uncharacterized protein n=1 Tax=Muraenolepis orangiensis TaxID=630683 RepID=A0A9Q0I5D2_9TELE|nr:hypothetical protein NHX12_014182 [Muraenolepis orangiensis]